MVIWICFLHGSQSKWHYKPNRSFVIQYVYFYKSPSHSHLDGNHHPSGDMRKMEWSPNQSVYPWKLLPILIKRNVDSHTCNRQILDHSPVHTHIHRKSGYVLTSIFPKHCLSCYYAFIAVSSAAGLPAVITNYSGCSRHAYTVISCCCGSLLHSFCSSGFGIFSVLFKMK